MPEMQSPAPGAAAAPALMEAVSAPGFDEPDYPLGCECADPALQIERWLQEARGAGEAP